MGKDSHSANGVITYKDDVGNQRIYAFVLGTDSNLHVNYWDGHQWHWANQGSPQNEKLKGYPSIVTFKDNAGRQLIYAFIANTEGKLRVNYWDGYQWQWAKQGSTPGTSLGSVLGCISSTDIAGTRHIQVFIRGEDGRLFINYWDGHRWNWASQFNPPGTTVSDEDKDGIISYENSGKNLIYAFIRGTNKHLYVNYWDGDKWQWADQGTPPWQPPSVAGYPSAITFEENGIRRIYAFVRTTDSLLAVNYWDGYQWKWANQDSPRAVSVYDVFRAISYKDDDGSQRIYVFCSGSYNDGVYVNYWNGQQWLWAKQGSPASGSKIWRSPGVITYKDKTGKQRIYAFVQGVDDKHLHVNYWNGYQWKWADQGKIP